MQNTKFLARIELMAAELKKHGVEHQLVTIPGAEHGLAGGDSQLITAAYQSAFEFVKRHLDK